MIRYIFTFFILFPAFLNAQSLYQNPILDYLGSSLNEAGLTNGSIGRYNGLGKRFLLENHPTSLGKGITTTFSPKGNSPFLLGGLTQHSMPISKSVIQLSGSHFGEVDLVAKGRIKVKRIINNLQINGHFFNKRMDKNEDGFIDLSSRKRLLVNNNSFFQIGPMRSRLELFYLKLGTQGGEFLFDKKEHYLKNDVYGFGDDVDHLGFKWSNRFTFEKGTTTEFLRINLAGRQHRQNSYFGTKSYQGDENLLEGMVNYQRLMLLSELNVGLQYKYQNTDEKLVKQSLNRKESVVGLYANYDLLLSQKWQLRTFANLDYHNLLDWEFHPSAKLNYTPNDKLKLGFFAGTGYQFSNILAENQNLLISSRRLFFNEISPTKAAYFGGAMQANLSSIFNINRPTMWKMQYFYRIYDNQTILDADQAKDELHFYNLEGKARRQVLENMLTYQWRQKLNFTAIYRLDLAKTTIDNQYRMLPFHSNHSLFLVGNYFWSKKVNFQITYLLKSRQRVPNTIQKSPISQRLDVLVEVPFEHFGFARKWRPFTFFMGVENVFNQKQTPIYRSPNAPFGTDFDGGMRWGREVGVRFFGGARYLLR